AEREDSLVQVAVRVLLRVVGVGALPGALIKRPEVLYAVGVNVPTDILTRAVIDGLVVEVALESEVRLGLVGVERRARLHPVTDAGLKRLGSHRVNLRGDQGATALQGT